MESRRLAIERLRLRREALEGRVAVVTGAGDGIGREIARALAALGATVVIAERLEAGIETERLINEAGGKAFFIRTDVAIEPDVMRLARLVAESFGPAEILINGASLCTVASMLEMDAAVWDRVIATNLRGAFLAARAFLPEMLRRKQGTIVNVVSTEPLPYLVCSSASSEALVGLTKALAAEVGNQGVRVIAFAPGMVDTVESREIIRDLAVRFGFAPEEMADVSAHHAYDGSIPADHAAAAAAYLIAALADECHGQKVSSYTILERAGFIEQVSAPSQSGETSSDVAATVAIEVALAKRLQRVIHETDAEINRLATYVRPLARRSFEAKTGQTTADWRQTAASLTVLLEKTADGEEAVENTLQVSYPALKDWLGKLLAYYHEAPAEMANLTRDANLLRDVSFYSPQRETSIRFLIEALDRLIGRRGTTSLPIAGRS